MREESTVETVEHSHSLPPSDSSLSEALKVLSQSDSWVVSLGPSETLSGEEKEICDSENHAPGAYENPAH